jgi:ATP-binding cassette subfamily C protein
MSQTPIGSPGADEINTRWRDLWRLLDRRQATVVTLLSLASALTEGLGLILLVPMLQAVSGGEKHQGTLVTSLNVPKSLGVLLVLFVMLIVLRAGLSLARQLATQQLQASLVDGLRTRAWDALLHCQWRVLATMRQSDNSSLLITNVDMVGFGLMQLMGSIASGVTLLSIGVAALVISPLITLLAVSGGVLVLIAYRGLRRRARTLGEAHNQAYALIHSDIGEALAALRIIKTLGVEDNFVHRLRSHICALRDAQRAFIRDVGFGQILLQGGGASLLALVVWLAVRRWDASVASVLPMVALFARALPLLDALQQAWQNASHALPSLGRALALLHQVESNREADAPRNLIPPTAEQSIRLERVGISYPGRAHPALVEIDFELRLGTITAVNGPSGAGKSTMADVLSGLISPDAGRLIIDGKPLDSAARRVWRKQVAYVQQDPILFTGSVRENMLLSQPGASLEEMREALRRASADFVERMPGGLDASLGDRGLRLSGGERQRIALARGLLRRPRLMILDEPASALDEDNEAAIANAVQAMSKDMAVLIIGHRGSLADIADRKIRIECGRIVS